MLLFQLKVKRASNSAYEFLVSVYNLRRIHFVIDILYNLATNLWEKVVEKKIKKKQQKKKIKKRRKRIVANLFRFVSFFSTYYTII